MYTCALKDGSEIGITRVEESDAEEIVDISIEMGKESDNLTFGQDDFYFNCEQEKNYISGFKNRENCLYAKAVLNGKIIGTLNFSAPSRKRVAHRGMLGLTILKKYWGLGVGSNLMEYFLQWVLKNRQISKIDLEVKEDNVRAIKLYLKYGFKIEGRITKGILIDSKFYDIYYMGKEIQ